MVKFEQSNKNPGKNNKNHRLITNKIDLGEAHLSINFDFGRFFKLLSCGLDNF